MKAKKLGRGLSEILSTQSKAIPEPPIKPVDTIPPPKEILSSEEVVKPPMKEQLDTMAKDRGVIWLRITDIIPNRFQPRKEFDPQSLKELTNSISSSGVIQPVLVRPAGTQYELIAGERRWRACRALNMGKMPVIIKDADDKTLLEWAIIENTQRKDLNAIERARAYKEFADLFHLTHEEVANRIGLDRSTVSNFIRLLDLPGEVQEEVSRGTISMGHARAILSMGDSGVQIKLARRIKKEGMSVRRLEYVIRYLKRRSKQTFTSSKENLYLKELEDRLRRKFGTKITITSYKSRGYVSIAFFSNDDFQRILELLEK